MKKRIILVALLPLLVYFTADCLGIFEPQNVAYLMAFRYVLIAYGFVGVFVLWLKDRGNEVRSAD